MNSTFRLLFKLTLIISVIACGSDKNPEPEAPAEPKPRAVIPAFNADSAYAYIEKQLSFGPRVPGSAGHKACKEWLVSTLGQWADDVIEQEFKAKNIDGSTPTATNIIAVFNPEIKERIILAAHWDTRAVADYDKDTSRKNEPIPGADDGGSGVGVLLEIARILSENKIDLGVDIILFDAEDQGAEGGGDMESWCQGAQYWSRNHHVKGYRASFGILLDMVGSEGARFTKEGTSVNYANHIVEKVWPLAQGMGYGGFFVNDVTGPITDDHYFVNVIAGIPMIDIINRPRTTATGFGHYWHTHDDTIDVISKTTLRAVGQVVLAVTFKTSDGTF